MKTGSTWPPVCISISLANDSELSGNHRSVVVIAALQRRTVIPTIGRLAFVAVRGLRPPQRRLIRILVRNRLLAVLKSRQASFHFVEFGSVHDVFRPRRQNFANLFLALQNAVRSWRMASESLG